MKKRPMFWSAVIAIVAVDAITKYLAHNYLRPAYTPRDIIGEWVRLTLLYNPGAAFGLHVGPNSRWVFILLTIGALVVLARLYQQTSTGHVCRAAALGLVVGGALGNLVNRIWVPAGVVDWIDIGLADRRWPAFNIADIGVSVGALLLAFVLWKEDETDRKGDRMLQRSDHRAPVE
jgi:signal peptidase II